ncbi:MAG TPA: hypothetical protein VII65_00795 [Acidimicrobiales bacterium]
MSDLEDRLAALDPAVRQPYQHQNLESMISRVTQLPTTSRGRVWRNFQLKFAGALVTSALLTSGAIASFSSGPTFAVLSIQSANGAAAPTASKSASGATMEIYEEFNFSAGSGLSSTSPASPSYALQVPSDASSEASRVAAIFGVTGTPVNTNGDGSDWTVTDTSGNSLDYQRSGVPQWSFTSTSTGVAQSSEAGSLGVLPNHSAVDTLAQSYVSKLGYGYRLSAPSFDSSTLGTLNPDGSMKTAVSDSVVTYTVLVDGTATDQSLSFSVNSNDVVVAASGPAFTLGSPQNYPLESPQAGIAALNTVQRNRFPHSATTTSTQSIANSGTTNTTVLSGPPIVDVTLNSYSLSLATYQLSDGSMWLLPVFNYAGQAANTYGTSGGSTWQQLALNPSYVKVSTASPGGSTHGVVNY